MPTEKLKDYYGEEISIYYEWMNFFTKWIFWPAVIAITIFVFNCVFFQDRSKSPLNAAFSIMMGFWATLFSAGWRRHERELKVLWGNLENSDR